VPQATAVQRQRNLAGAPAQPSVVTSVTLASLMVGNTKPAEQGPLRSMAYMACKCAHLVLRDNITQTLAYMATRVPDTHTINRTLTSMV
jgi:hypothetical protein